MIAKLIERLRGLPSLFWLGLGPAVFVLWVWSFSLGHRTSWELRRSQSLEIQVLIQGSQVIFYRITPEEKGTGMTSMWPLTQTGPFGRFRVRELKSPLALGATWFPMPKNSETVSRHYDTNLIYRQWFLPLWLALALYVPLWWGLTARQARRKREVMAALGESGNEK